MDLYPVPPMPAGLHIPEGVPPPQYRPPGTIKIDIPPLTWLLGMVSEDTESPGSYIRGTPPQIREQVVRTRIPWPASYPIDRQISVYFKARRPNPSLRSRRAPVEDYVDIRACSGPVSVNVEERALIATLSSLEQDLGYKIPDYSSIKLHALDLNEDHVPSMAVRLSHTYPLDGMSIGLGSIVRYVAPRIGLGLVTGPISVGRVVGDRTQYWMRFDGEGRNSVVVYGEALRSYTDARASVYLYALREFESMGVQIIDLNSAVYRNRIERIS